MKEETKKSITGDITPLSIEDLSGNADFIIKDNKGIGIAYMSNKEYGNYFLKACNLFPELVEALEGLVEKCEEADDIIDNWGGIDVTKAKSLIQKAKQ